MRPEPVSRPADGLGQTQGQTGALDGSSITSVVGCQPEQTGALVSKPQRPSGHRGFPQAFGHGTELQSSPRTAPNTPIGKKTRHESPRNRHDGQATGRGALVAPLGTTLLREEAPVGSAESSKLRHRGDRKKVAGRERWESLCPPARWWDEPRLGGRTDGPRMDRTHRLGGWAPGAPATRGAEIHGNRKANADPHKEKPKGASGDEEAETRPGRNGLHGGRRP
jgi:hypothetical protein